MVTSTGRPTPLRDVAATWSKIMGAAGGVLTALVTVGILTAAQGDAVGVGFDSVNLLLSAVVGLVAAAPPIISAFKTARLGERYVTPVSDPRNALGERLLPEPPTTLAGPTSGMRT